MRKRFDSLCGIVSSTNATLAGILSTVPFLSSSIKTHPGKTAAMGGDGLSICITNGWKNTNDHGGGGDLPARSLPNNYNLCYRGCPSKWPVSQPI